MDKLKSKVASARNKVAESTSRGTGSASLSVPHSTLPPEDNASTTAVNNGHMGPQPGTSTRDFARQSAQQPTMEPPTSLESSVDAGAPVPMPATESSSRPRSASTGQAGLRPPDQVAGRARSNSAGQQTSQSNRPPAMRQPSIGIRRLGSSQAPGEAAAAPAVLPPQGQASTTRLPVVDETCALEHAPSHPTSDSASTVSSATSRRDHGLSSQLKRVSTAVKSKLGFGTDQEKDTETGTGGPSHTRPLIITPAGREYGSSMVDVLDTLDAEVQTLTSLTNVQNSLFVPNLGRFVNRRPTYVLQQTPSEKQSLEEINAILEPARQAEAQAQAQAQAQASPTIRRAPSDDTMATIATIDSNMSDTRFAVLPHGASLDGWSKEDKAELNDHVRHMLHSRRSKFKRSMKGFGQYVRRPLGFLVTLYATLITLFGLAWVLFLIGWINVGGRQIYVIHIIDSVLVALFAIVGDGLAPFRAVDTYHMIYMAHYHHYTWSRRKKDQLPKLQDHNDLPATNAPITSPRDTDPEDPEKQWEFTVLTPKQQAKLEHHEAKFCKSHSFYKPHETETHYAFPLRLLVAIVVLLDCHSLLQIALGACTWGIYYKVRPFALTTVILCCSITCNATAGLLILIGDRRTRKNDVLERMNRQELTAEAIHKVEKKRERGSESEGEEGLKGSRKSEEGRRSLDIFNRLHRKSLDHKRAGGDATSPNSPPPPVPPKADGKAYFDRNLGKEE